MTHMSDHEMKLWLQEKLGPRRSGRREALAEYLGVSLDKITRWANTEPGKESHIIPAHIFQAVQAYFDDYVSGVEPSTSTVPIMGFLGAGAEIEPEFEQVPPEGLDSVELPFAVPDEMVAFSVRGISMMPVYRPGTIIVVYRDQKKPIESFYGLEAAVRTSDGRRFIKTINIGAKPNTVTLVSFNDPDIIADVRLEWIGEIFAVLPPAAVRAIGRNGGLQGRLSLPAT